MILRTSFVLLHSLLLKSSSHSIVVVTVIHYNHCIQLLQDGLVAEHEFDRMQYVVRKLFDLKLQLHAIETEPSLPLPADVIEHTIALMLDLYSEGILSRLLFICVCTHLL